MSNQLEVTVSSNELSNSLNTKNQVNGIFTNINNTLLSLATNSGYRIYSMSSFTQLTETDDSSDIMDMIGALKIAIPFYESEIILLVGKNQTSSIKDNQIVLWNDTKRTQLAMISFDNFNSVINATKITKECLFIALDNVIHLYEIKSLKQISTITDVMSSNLSMAITYENNDTYITLCDVQYSNKSNIKVNRYKSTNDVIVGRNEDVIQTPFNSIYKIAIDSKGEFALVIAENDNRVHVYNTFSKKNIYCFDIEKMYTRIINVAICKKSSFILVFYADHSIEIYKPRNKGKCECFGGSNKDKEIPFARYKYGHRYIDELVSYNVGKDEMNNGFIVRFPKMGEIEMIDSHGICQKIKFNTREKDDIWCYKEIKF